MHFKLNASVFFLEMTKFRSITGALRHTQTNHPVVNKGLKLQLDYYSLTAHVHAVAWW